MNKNRRICFVADSFISDTTAMITGPMVQTYLLGKELQKRGWDVHFIAFSREGKHNLIEFYDGLVVHWINHRRFFPVFNFYWLQKLLVEVDSNYHYQRGREILTGMVAYYCKKRNRTFIWSSNGEIGIERGKYVTQVKKKNRPMLTKSFLMCEAKINDLIYEFGIKNATRILVQTESQKKRLRESFGLDSCIVKTGHPIPEITERTSPLKILWIGSIKSVKRPDLFVDLAYLCRHLPCKFWIAGQFVDLDIQSQLNTRIQSMENITYLGAIPFSESQTLISRAHILVNTTEEGYEGFPNSFAQAWLAGTLTFSLNSNPDDLITKFGLGIAAGTLDQMKLGIENAIDNPARLEAMSRNARNFAITHCSIEKVTNDIFDIK